MTADAQALVQLFTERLVNTAIAGIVLAGLVYIMLRLVGRQNSETRFAMWFTALLAVVILPFFSGSVFYSAHLHSFSAGNTKGEITLSSSWANYLFVAWGAVAAILLFRIAIGLWRVRQVRSNCTAIDLASMNPAAGEILHTYASRRAVTLCVSSEVSVPSAIGLFQPAIVFPEWLLPKLSMAEVEMIIRHELAHLERRDDWTNLAQKIVKALFFFHPAVWWIERRLTLEREMACDDMVLAQTERPHAYASSLISFAEKLQSARGLALAQALVSRMHEMSVRLAQILDAKRPKRIGLWKPTLALSAGLLALVVGAAPYMPRVVAFESQPRSSTSMRNVTANSEVVGQGSPAVLTRERMLPVAQRQNVVPQARAIQAAFHPRAVALPRQLKTITPKTPLIFRPELVRASAEQQQAAAQPAIYVLQTTEYDAPSATGPGVWTFCIWKINANNPAERQLESAIVVSWI